MERRDKIVLEIFMVLCMTVLSYLVYQDVRNRDTTAQIIFTQGTTSGFNQGYSTGMTTGYVKGYNDGKQYVGPWRVPRHKI